MTIPSHAVFVQGDESDVESNGGCGEASLHVVFLRGDNSEVESNGGYGESPHACVFMVVSMKQSV